MLKAASLVSLVVLATIALGSTLSGQNQQPARGQAPAQGRGQPPATGRAAAPAPPAPQAGHPSGKLVIWGDVVNFNPNDQPNACVAQSRFKRGERIGFRMTAVDGGTGDVENTAILVAHLSFGGRKVDVPLNWRGNVPFPKEAYLRPPNEMWTGGWVVPADAPIGMITYTVTATDRFGRTATFSPFASIPSQLAIVQ